MDFDSCPRIGNIVSSGVCPPSGIVHHSRCDLITGRCLFHSDAQHTGSCRIVPYEEIKNVPGCHRETVRVDVEPRPILRLVVRGIVLHVDGVIVVDDRLQAVHSPVIGGVRGREVARIVHVGGPL